MFTLAQFSSLYFLFSDNRVHCCFYFVNPSGHGLRPVDVQFMRLLHERVNIVPVIGKADTLTKKEVAALKRKILSEIAGHHIRMYNFPEGLYYLLNKRLLD